jgi:hypothetical protein
VKLRELKLEDAEHMLEWMQDDTVVHDLYTNFLKMTIDKYLGAVSLKNIDYRNGRAEFAIDI